ncbi:hypothetical protein D9M68_369210 [compost metagenome]
MAAPAKSIAGAALFFPIPRGVFELTNSAVGSDALCALSVLISFVGVMALQAPI